MGVSTPPSSQRDPSCKCREPAEQGGNEFEGPNTEALCNETAYCEWENPAALISSIEMGMGDCCAPIDFSCFCDEGREWKPDVVATTFGESVCKDFAKTLAFSSMANLGPNKSADCPNLKEAIGSAPDEQIRMALDLLGSGYGGCCV